MTLREAPVHLEQFPRPQGGFLSPGTGADLDDQVLAVVRILRHQQVFQLRPQGVGPRLGLQLFILEEGPHLRIGLGGGHLGGVVRLRLGGEIGAVRGDDLLQVGERHAERTQSIQVRGGFGSGHLGGHLLVARFDLAQSFVEIGRHGPIIPAQGRDRPLRDVARSGRSGGGVGSVLVEVELDRREIGDVDRCVVALLAAREQLVEVDLAHGGALSSPETQRSS